MSEFLSFPGDGVFAFSSRSDAETLKFLALLLLALLLPAEVKRFWKFRLFPYSSEFLRE
jgi:hypothetical protein